MTKIKKYEHRLKENKDNHKSFEIFYITFEQSTKKA